MRPALSRCASSHLVLFDFLAPRLNAAPRPRFLHVNASHSLRHSISTRHSSVSAAARTTANKPSILDATSSPECDLSYHAAQMHKCALDEDILGVWNAYGHIRDKHPRLVLGPQHYGATSLMLVKLFADTISSKNRTEEEMRAVEELAFACAGAGYVEGFRQMLLWLLAQRDAERIIKAYERFEQTVLLLDDSGLERGTIDPDVAVNEENSSEESSYEEGQTQARLENPDISQLDVTNIMAITVAAYAHQNRFYDALQFMLRQTSRRVTGDNLEDLERELKACGNSDDAARNLTTKTEEYVEAGSIARLVRTPEVFKAHVRNLLADRNPLNKLEKLRRVLRNGFSSELAWAATDESKQSPTRPIVVSEKIWAYLVHAYISVRKEDIAEQLWADVIRFGKTPGIHMWNALLEGYRDTRQPQKLAHAWDVMKKQRIRYDARSYGAKLGCLCQERLTGQYLLKSFEEFRQAMPNTEDGLFVYNTVLEGLLSRKDLQSAMVLFEQMKKHGPPPDVVSYNTFIAFYAKKANLKGIADTVQQLTNARIEPDVFTFTSILTAMLKARVPNCAEQLLSIMENMGVKQNVATYSAIIDSQVRQGTRTGITAAWQLLQQMERRKDKDIKPNLITYTSFLAGVHRSQELDKGLITSISSDIVQTMKKRGIQLRLGTYHILFKACLENPNREALDFFIDYYNMMRSSGEISLWHDTWYVILDGLVRRGAWKLASEMKNQMLESGFQPMWGVTRRMKLIQNWEAQNARVEDSVYN